MSPIGPSRKEMALDAAGFACTELYRILVRDPAFRRYIGAILAGRQTADDVAREYFRDAAKRREIMRGLIARAVREHERVADVTFHAPRRARWRALEQVLQNPPRHAWWADEALSPGDPQRPLQLRAEDSITHGARLIARLGAGQCLACGAALSARTRPSPRSGSVERWQRVRYCDCCNGDVLREAHTGLIRRVVADVGVSLGLDDAASRRRSSRSAPRA